MAGVFPPAPLDLPLRFSRCSLEAGFALRVPVVPTAQASSQVPPPAFGKLPRSFRPLVAANSGTFLCSSSGPPLPGGWLPLLLLHLPFHFIVKCLAFPALLILILL